MSVIVDSDDDSTHSSFLSLFKEKYEDCFSSWIYASSFNMVFDQAIRNNDEQVINILVCHNRSAELAQLPIEEKITYYKLFINGQY